MAKRSDFLIVLSLSIMVVLPSIGYPYIPPTAQIIEFMSDKFATIRTLKITQLTRIRDLNQEIEKVFGEIIYVRSPDLYRSEIAGQPGKRLLINNGKKTLSIINGGIAYERQARDPVYRFLLLAQSPKRLLDILRGLHISLNKASLTRFEGRIAYLIGEKEEGSPRLLVDKDLFLPLLLEYGNILLRFSDYRELREGIWYPYKIVYSLEYEAITEEYTVKDVIVNPRLDLSLFNISLIRARFGKSE